MLRYRIILLFILSLGLVPASGQDSIHQIRRYTYQFSFPAGSREHHTIGLVHVGAAAGIQDGFNVIALRIVQEKSNNADDLYYYSNHKDKYVFISEFSKANEGRAVVDLGIVGNMNEFIDFLGDNKVTMSKMQFSFRDLLLQYIKLYRSTMNIEADADYELLAIPMVDSISEKVNIPLRQAIFGSAVPGPHSRILFVLFDQSNPQTLPSFIDQAAYFSCNIMDENSPWTFHKPTNDNTFLTHTEPAIQSTSAREPVVTSSTLTMEDDVPGISDPVEKKGIELWLKGNCPDGLTLEYTIPDPSGIEKGTVQVTDNRAMIYYDFPPYFREDDELTMEINPPQGYYLSVGREQNETLQRMEVSIPINNQTSVVEFNINSISTYHILYVDVNSFSKKRDLLYALRDSLKVFESQNDQYLLFLANNISPVFGTTPDGYLSTLSRIQTMNTEPAMPADDWKTISETIDVNALWELHKLKPVCITLVLSENTYNVNRNLIIDYLEQYLGNTNWQIRVITDFEVKKRIKNYKEIIINKTDYITL